MNKIKLYFCIWENFDTKNHLFVFNNFLVLFCYAILRGPPVFYEANDFYYEKIFVKRKYPNNSEFKTKANFKEV